MTDKKKSAQKSPIDLTAQLKKIQKNRNTKNNTKPYEPTTVFISITVGLLAILVGLQFFDVREIAEEPDLGARFPTIKDIEYSRTNIRVHLTKHPKNVSKYQTFIARKRKNASNVYYLAEQSTGIQNIIEFTVDVYETYEYEFILKTDLSDEPMRQTFEISQLNGKMFEEDEIELVKSVQDFFEAEKSYIDIAEYIGKVNEGKDHKFLQYLQGYALVMESTKQNQEDKMATLEKALKILIAIGRDETTLIDVRLRALTLAMDRSAVIEQYPVAIEIGQLLLQLKPNNNYDILKHVGDVYLAASNYEKSAEMYEKVLKIDPSEGIASARLGAALFHLDRFEEAIEHLRTGIDSKEPGTEDPYFKNAFVQAASKLSMVDEDTDGDSEEDQEDQEDDGEKRFAEYENIEIVQSDENDNKEDETPETTDSTPEENVEKMEPVENVEE